MMYASAYSRDQEAVRIIVVVVDDMQQRVT